MESMRFTDEASYSAQHRRTDELHEAAMGRRSSADVTYMQPTPDIDVKLEPDDSASPESVRPSNGRYYCLVPGCSHTGKDALPTTSFASQSGLKRHISMAHSEHPPLFDCRRPQCERRGQNAFKRKDMLLNHQGSNHAEEIPKRGHDVSDLSVAQIQHTYSRVNLLESRVALVQSSK